MQNHIELINSYLGVSDIEKKKLGEVFTPFPLIREMLDTLPIEMWSNPDLKWLDPANGIGNFPAIVVEKLMEGLEDIFPDEEKRYEHILENMIYVCDIQPKNMFIYLMIFDPENKYKMNYYTGSFLDEGFDKYMKEEWGLDRFDIVIGNPPYQEINKSGTRKTGGANLYTKFIRKSYNISNYLLFITPPTWMNTGSDEIDIFSKNQINTLNINECKKYFNVGSQFSYFLLEKTPPYRKTIVKCEFNKRIYDSFIDIKDFNYLPMLLTNEAINIYNKLNIEEKLIFNINFKFDHRRDYISKEETTKFKYKLKHTSKQFRYSSLIHPAQNNKKVLFSRSGNISPEFDMGIMGTTDGVMWVNVKNKKEGKNLINFINSNLIKFILKTYKWNGFNDVTILKNLPKIDLSKSWTDEELYKYFNLTEEEIKLIEETVK